MISTMREYFRGLKFVLLFVIVAFVGTSVVYFGASSFSGSGGPGGTAVATVNGEEIPAERYRRAYQSYLEFYRQIYKERLTPELAERLGISQQVIDALVQDALIVQQAEREGLRVTHEEVSAHLWKVPEFQEDGRFSQQRYQEVLKRNRIDPNDFYAGQKRAVQRRKMEALVKDGIRVSDDELRQAYGFRREKVRAAWAALDVQPLMAQVTVPDADVEPYLKSHQAQFTRPERRRIQYAVLSTRAFAQPVSDADAEAYYTEHGAEFDTPRRAQASHVLVRVPPTGGSEAEGKSRAKIAEVIRRAKAGEDFAKLARETSEDTATAARGGDLGLVGPGEVVPQFERAVFALKKGEVSPEPVRTPFGYHAIKVMDVQEGGREPFKEAAGRIKEKLLAERSDKGARARAEDSRTPLAGAKDFAGEARRLGFEAREATIARGDGLEGVGRDEALEDAVFSLASGGVSIPMKTAGGYAIVKVVESLAAGVPPLGDIRLQIVEAIKRERAEALALERARALATAAKGGDLAPLARREGFSTGETPLFSRTEPPKGGAGLPGPVLLAALQTAAGQLAEPVRTPTGVYVVKTLERAAPDPLGFEAERAELGRQVLEQKRTQAWEGWVKGLQAAANIQVSGQVASPRR